jgi:beta-lactamase regulating signal transducer with metallopeptidase domain
MNSLELALRQPWVARAGWALVHFLWQGAAIAIIFAVLRAAAGRRLTPRARYAAACFALAAMALAPLATFLALDRADASQLPAPLFRVSPAAWDRILPWCVVAWLCGVALFSIRLICGWRCTVRLRTAGVRPAPSEWQRSLEELVRRMRVSAPVRLLVSSRAAVPMVVGWLRPVVLMPTAALLGLPPEQVQALLAHELAHILRRDYLVNVLQSVAEALLFYHPAVWWVSGQIRADRELCCDDLAVAASGDAFTYACALADLESARRARPETALAADGGSLLDRIRRLAGEAQPLHSLPGPATAWALALLWFAGLGAAALHGAAAPVANAARQSVPLARAAATSALPLAPPQMVGAKPAQGVAARSGLPRLTSALLFDPLFSSPQQQSVPDASVAVPPKKTHLEGRVLSLAGEPVKRATLRLTALDLVLASAQASQQSVFTVTTDEDGKFVIEGPGPGSYTLSANKTGFIAGNYGARTSGPASPGTTLTVTEGAQMPGLDIRLMPQAVISGNVVDADGEPVPHGWIKLFYTAYSRGRKTLNFYSTTTNSLGNFTLGAVPPGRYYLSGEVLQQSPDEPPGMGDIVTYYPSALDPYGAAEFQIAAGERLEGVNIRLRRERTYSVTGVVMLNGALFKDQMGITVTPPAGRPQWTLRPGDGKFLMHEQLPGTYSLDVAYSGAQAGLSMAGHLEFTIKDENISGLVVQLQEGSPVGGILTLDGADWAAQAAQNSAASNAATPDMTAPAVPQLLVGLVPTSGNGFLSSVTAGPDGSFRTRSVPPGAYMLTVSRLSKGMYVKSVRYGTQDVTLTPIPIGAEPAPLEIDIGSKGGAIAGALQTDAGDPMRGIAVTAWPKVPNNGISSHGVKSASTDQNGAFNFSSLAPGEYYVAAWEDIDNSLRTDPDFLARFNDRVAAVKLEEGAQAGVTVKLISKDAIQAEAAKLP